MSVPERPKIYHIVHVDKLASIVADGYLWSDSVMAGRRRGGTVIGMEEIKQRRLGLPVSCHPETCVGEYVPFYFCPRSVMLYLIFRRNDALLYKGGQEPIIHLEADLKETIAWAADKDRRWAFTLSNAGACYFEDRSDIGALNEINWDAVQARQWSGNGISQSIKDGKQAEFLIERAFPWHLIERVGVHSQGITQQVYDAMSGAGQRPKVEIRREWYY